jgi:hypothetical protein
MLIFRLREAEGPAAPAPAGRALPGEDEHS